MKKITTLFLGIIAMLNVANAQDITVFDFDGTTPTFSSWSDSFSSVANPVSDGVNSSTNVGEYNHNAQWSNVSTDVDIDPRIYTSYQIKVYSPAAGTLSISCKNAAEANVDSYSTSLEVATGWNTLNRNLVTTQQIKKIAIGFKTADVAAGDSSDIVYLDDLTFIKTSNTEITLYAENFSADVADWEGWKGLPSEKVGKWLGAIDLETTANDSLFINRNWGEPSTNVHELYMKANVATVTIPNINIMGYDTFELSFDNVAYSGDTAPVVEYQNGGSWMPITVDLATSTWATQTIALSSLDDAQPFSLRFLSDATLPYLIDNLKLTGVEKTLSVDSNQLNKNAVSFYPNPASDYITIKNAQKISIIDMNGRLVKEANAIEKVDVSSLVKGIYLVKLVSENNTQISKLIKK